jgi:EXPERA (EXPanded EBP superfamily)
LTVFLVGPASVYVCYLLFQLSSPRSSANTRAAAKAHLWFVAPAIAIAELYGGWMTFAPEWLTGSSQLETGHPVYLWLYLVFFNTLWVFLPAWVLWETTKELRTAFVAAERTTQTKKSK